MIKKGSFSIFRLLFSFKNSKGKTVTVEGKIHGKYQKILGKKGFGYDPIFIPKSKTYLWTDEL